MQDQMAQDQQPQAPDQGEDQVGELVAKISSDLLALKEASPEAFAQLLGSLQSDGAEEESEEAGMVPAMAGAGGVPMSHGR